MQTLRSILVGLDVDADREALTEGSRAAARQALWLAQRTRARVEFLHSTYRNPEDGPSIQDGHGASICTEVDALRSECGGGVDTSQVILAKERPWVAITRRVLAGDSDLVVVAKRNHTKRDDRKLGSVSMKLVRKCPAPVWVVKPEHEFVRRSVLAATDLSPVGDLATEYGAFIAEAHGCKLFVVHAWQVPMELQLSAARIGEQETARRRKEIADAARGHIRGLAAVAGMEDRAEVFVACDSPSQAILRVAGEKAPELVVMGTVSRGGFAGKLVGNTAEKLLYRLDCSILTVKPEDFVCPLVLEDERVAESGA